MTRILFILCLVAQCASGAVYNWTNTPNQTAYVAGDSVAGGSQDPGGTINATTDWAVDWISMR